MWNRFINVDGGKGLNIPLDLHKEHQNRLLKVMWRALGPNLNEKSAQRVAGTLELMEMIMKGIDDDCKLQERSSYRAKLDYRDLHKWNSIYNAHNN